MITQPCIPVLESAALTEMPMARAYVRTESGAEHTLEYYIFSPAESNEAADYGITIKQYDSDTILSESVLVSKDKEEVVKLIDCFARNFVFPCSLPDLISDMGHALKSTFITNRQSVGQ